MRRRDLLAAAAVTPVLPAQTPAIDPAVVARHDSAVETYLKLQITDPSSRWHGGFLDEYGLCYAGTAAGSWTIFVPAFLHPGSKFHKNALMIDRLRLSAQHLARMQNAEGNIDNPVTNFNSPADLSFAVRGAATAAVLAARAGDRELTAIMEPFLRKAGGALAAGGVHTANHRWVVCAALAQLNELFPSRTYTQRIDRWLAEGIDIDEDGQFAERSTSQYNPIVDSALVVMAAKLKRPELLDAARRNLDSMLYLMHGDLEPVTEISRRQDRNQPGSMVSYWFALRYLATHDGNGQFATLARIFQERAASLAILMEYPELSAPLPATAPLPDDYEREFRKLGITRIRRRSLSATLFLSHNSRFLNVRDGDAVVSAVRFASAFFGKGQFVPAGAEKKAGAYVFEQPELVAAYYQPLEKARSVPADEDEWYRIRKERKATEVCRLVQSAEVTEIPNGLRVRVRSQGTSNVPAAIEVSLRAGGKLENCVAAPNTPDGWLLGSGHAQYTMGADTVRIGPGLGEHRYTQVRGAEAKIPGPAVYLCGFTPFDHTFEIVFSTNRER
ncbi:MAG: hypothetical protein EXQ52_05965 [Bryobacterales bacterium]|nr:hypothetical protein [Bryobacterales bacterium]